jgi:hemolysin III
VVTRPPEPGRPRLRGWIHAVAAPFVLAAGIVITWRAPTMLAAAVAGVFAATAAWLFTVSALYHLGAWSPGARLLLRRIDHVDILFLIAGTYTPLAVLALHGGTRVAILAVVWAGAALGAVLSIAWTSAPRWVYVPVYLGVGWAAACVLPQLLHGAGMAALVLIVAGGVLYSLGALAYGLKRPNPWPGWFGFHEVFHACTVAAFACQYAAVWIVACRAA